METINNKRIESTNIKRNLRSEKECVTIVAPVYNEKEGLYTLRESLVNTIEDWKTRGWGFGVEIILVNDGSTDGSKDIMNSFVREDPRFNVIHLSRNFGHQEALSAGLLYASGSCVAVLDADMQDPPELIGEFLEKWSSGIDIVYGIRKRRKGRIIKRIFYSLFYRIYKLLASIDIPLDSGDFCLMDRKVVNVLNGLPEKIRFVRGLRSWTGFKQFGIEYERPGRKHGDAKYTFAKLVRLAFTGFFGFSTVPLRVATAIGFCSMFFGFAFAIFIIILYFYDIKFFGHNPADVAGFTSLFAGLMIFSGFQLLALGVIGEYIGILFLETKNRPAFVVDSITGNLKC
jgi:dolichol-phosphate mannosyltransferase|tara:strand:- start:1011 stop:2042 length:1032 start_codon:yes stop_codon:yes gene_type:complete